MGDKRNILLGSAVAIDRGDCVQVNVTDRNDIENASVGSGGDKMQLVSLLDHQEEHRVMVFELTRRAGVRLGMIRFSD